VAGAVLTSGDFNKFLPRDPDRSTHDLVRDILSVRHDYSKFTAFFHEDAVFIVVGQIYDYLFSGVYRGPENIVELLRRIDAEIEMSDHKILNLIIDGDKVGLRRSVLIRHRGTSASRPLVIGNFVIFRDRRIAELYEYVDTNWLKDVSGEAD
jgi:ketosteroid isomerase-like protein